MSLFVPERTRQAIDNLIDNALHYAHTRVEVRAEVEPSSTTITVADDGPGLPAEFDHRAFVAVERADGQRPDTGGAGLGLAIVRMIAETHGGTASAATLPDRGFIVTLKLPNQCNDVTESRAEEVTLQSTRLRA